MTRRLEEARSVVAGDRGGGLDQRLEQVDVVIAVHPLHDGRDALEAHAGIDRRLRQRP